MKQDLIGILQFNLKKLEPYFKYWPLIIAAPLIVGFIITNVYLLQFGFWDYSFFRVKYIGAGVVYIINLFVLIISANIGFRNIAKKIEVGKYKKSRSYFFITLLIIVYSLLYSVALNLLVQITSNNYSTDFQSIFNWKLFGWSIMVLIILWKINHTQTQKKDDSSNRNIPTSDFEKGFILFSGLAVIFLFISLGYSTLVYPFIPSAYGGGKPIRAAIYINEGNNLLSENGIFKNQNNPININLIYQSPDFLLIEYDNKVFTINYDKLAAIEYLDTLKYYESENEKNRSKKTIHIPVKKILKYLQIIK